MRPKTIAVILMLLSCAIYLPAAKCENFSAGTRLLQESAKGGLYDLVVTDKAMRLDIRQTRLTCVSKAPAWDMTMYRKDSKTMSVIQHKDWLKVLSPLEGLDRADWPVGTTVIAGRKGEFATKLFKFPSHKRETKSLLFTTQDPNLKVVNENLEVEIFASGQDRLKCQTINHFAGLPELPGIPLTIKGSSELGQSWNLRTRSIKSDSISDALFEIPKGLKLTPFSTGIYFSNAHKEDMLDFFGSEKDK